MTIEEMKLRKQELGYSYEQIAELSGLPLSTVQKVLGGITRTPRYDTIRALEEVLSPYSLQMLGEPILPYGKQKKQGEYTIDDLEDIPEDVLVELIDGVIYYMPTPKTVHQLLSAEIFYFIKDYIRKNQGNCIPFSAPTSVQLDCDNRTIVVPDIFVVCDRDKLQNGLVFGAPDLVIEILSPSTKRKDLTIKLTKYQNAGVREYWIVDPKKKSVVVYDLENPDLPELYTFEHQIPVKIFGGKCIVDFKEIYEYVEFIYSKQ